MQCNFFKRNLLLFFILFSFTACAVTVHKTAPLPARREHLYKRLINKVDLSNIKTMTSEIRVSIFSKGKHRGTFKGYLFYKKHRGMSCRIIGPFGITMADILIKNHLFEMFIPSKSTVFYTYNSFEEILLGGSMLKNRPYYLREHKKNIELSLINIESNTKEHSRVYIFDRSTLKWTGLKIYTKKGAIIAIKIKRLLKGIPVEFTVKTRDYSVRVSMKDIRVNTPVKESLFIKHFPAKRAPLDSLLKHL